MPAKEHLKENGIVYALIALLGGAGGIATFTDNLPVSRGEFDTHVEEYAQASQELEKIQGSLDGLVLAQLRAQLLQAYKDRCVAQGAEAIQYINREIERLQAEHVAIVSRRYEPPPCGVVN